MRTEKRPAAPEPRGKQSEMDQTLEDSFPASDPPSWATPHHHADEDIEHEGDDGTDTPPAKSKSPTRH